MVSAPRHETDDDNIAAQGEALDEYVHETSKTSDNDHLSEEKLTRAYKNWYKLNMRIRIFSVFKVF